MDARLLFPSEYLRAADLAGQDVTLTISVVVKEELQTHGSKKENKPIVSFVEMEERHAKDKSKENKRLVLNKTNRDVIMKLYGTETNGWKGKAIILYPTTCMMKGETVDCIRVRDR